MGLPRFLTRLVPAALAAALLVGCGGPSQQTTPPWAAQPAPAPAIPEPEPLVPAGPPTVGLLLPLTGPVAQLGADLQAAAELAVFDVGDPSLVLVPQDTGETPEGAVRAAHAAIDAGAELLLGPLFGRSTGAMAPIAADRGVNVLSFSNDASVAGPGVYVLGFRPEEQVARIVDYAARRGLSRFAALAPDDAYGSVAVAAWRDAVRRVPGATLVGVERYGNDAAGIAAAVQRLAGRSPTALPASDTPGTAPARRPGLPPFDSLLIADGGPRLRTVIATLPFYNVAGGNTRLLGTMSWQDDPALFSEQPVQGAWIASWSPPALERFSSRFQATYGRTPAPLAVLAYDGTALASVLAQGQPRFGTEQLTDPQGFTGGSGLFRLRPDGLTDHGLAILEVRNGTARVIDAAPTSFPSGLVAR